MLERERESAVRSVCCACISWAFVTFPFGFEGGMWDLIVLIPDHCLSIYIVMR